MQPIPNPSATQLPAPDAIYQTPSTAPQLVVVPSAPSAEAPLVPAPVIPAPVAQTPVAQAPVAPVAPLAPADPLGLLGGLAVVPVSTPMQRFFSDMQGYYAESFEIVGHTIYVREVDRGVAKDIVSMPDRMAAAAGVTREEIMNISREEMGQGKIEKAEMTPEQIEGILDVRDEVVGRVLEKGLVAWTLPRACDKTAIQALPSSLRQILFERVAELSLGGGGDASSFRPRRK